MKPINGNENHWSYNPSIKAKKLLKDAGEWEEKRKSQQVEWMWAIIRERILSKIETHEKVQSLVPQIELQVAESKLTPALAALEILTVIGNE